MLRLLTVVALIILAACAGKGKIGRYIDEKDTTFSKDIRDISAKINASPRDAKLYYLRGNAFFYESKFKDAGIDFETAVQLDSANSLYHYKLGENILQLDTSNALKALTHLRKAVQLSPENTEASLALAKLYIARQNYPEAEKIFRPMMKNTAIADKAYLLWGIAKKELKDTQSAMQLFEKSLVLNPSNTDAVLQLAGLYYHKDKAMAIKYYDRALAMDEYNYEALYAKGLLYQEQGKYDLALKHYDEVRNLRPGHLLAYNNSIVIYFIRGQWQKASELAEKYVLLSPQNANALAMKGFALENMGNEKAALNYYEAALKIDPGNPYAIKGKQALAP